MTLNIPSHEANPQVVYETLITKHNKSAAQTPVRQNKSGPNKKGAVKTNTPSQKSGPLNLKKQQIAYSIPTSLWSVKNGSTPGGMIVTGRELVTPIKSSSTTTLFGADNTLSAGSLLLQPTSFSRLQVFTTAYEFYKFNWCRCEFQSNQPTTIGGVSMIGFEADISDTVATTSVQLMRKTPSAMSNVYANNHIDILGSLARVDKFICVGGGAADAVQINQGTIEYAFEGIVATNAIQGYLVVYYECEFFVPT